MDNLHHDIILYCSAVVLVLNRGLFVHLYYFALCLMLKESIVFQLGRIYLDMLNIYKVMSGNIIAAIAVNGESITKQPLIKSMRVVKKETLKLISDWIEASIDHAMVSDSCHNVISVFSL